MRFLGNVIWFVLGGGVIALLWLIGALAFAISIIGLPLSRAAFEMAKMSAFPFGKEVVHVREIDQKGVNVVTATTGTIGFVANVIWLFTFGLSLALAYILAGILCCVTIVAIPFGIQAFKLAAISLWPVGRRVVTKEMAQAIRIGNAQAQLSAARGVTIG
ncbi:YccF family protein [Rhizobium sp. TH2]|uniref:YccF family protein n=1 Tax=Rhizobium sp. TH2 TaxID=2775403 RepID=UPI0021589FBB|nr:YccF family protein [Rhizobium sp. TH2]UVC08986.1 YccF family protein [Rhizobium sp. TH2]